MTSPMDKTVLVQHIIQQLDDALQHALAAAEEAHKGATHEQSKAETQYDTLGLEHAYLAEGQARRIQELQDNITLLRHFHCPNFNDNTPIYLGALVDIESLSCAPQHLSVFLVPGGGGLKITWEHKVIQVISSSSPITQALLGLYCGDECQLENGLKYSITQVQ